MDALSDILRAIKLKSCVYFRSDFASPWGMDMDAGPFAQFHMVVSGHCWLNMEGFDEPKFLTGGDIVMFPLGDGHYLTDDLNCKRVPGIKVLESIQSNESVFKGEKVTATLVCGHFEFDRDFDHPFLDALPQFIHIPSSERCELRWLETVTSVIMQETDSGHPGADIVTNRLAEVLFIQILRAYMIRNNFSEGYLAALRDRQISQALKLIHAQPESSWTLEAMARTVGMSRSSFFNRFKHFVGITPMDYITRWRMLKARELLKSNALPMIEIAEHVGYSSEAAFNRAFKRQFKENPGALRRAQRNL